MIGRRAFITLLGGAAWGPLAARAQQAAMPVIGFLHVGSAAQLHGQIAGFHRGLKEAHYVEGQNVAVQYRWAEDQSDRLPALAADLVDRQVTIIVAGANAAALAAKSATQTIPVVVSVGADPIKLGLVTSLNRPTGNVTGVSQFSNVLEAKRLGLLRELVPGTAGIALLVNPNNPAAETQSIELTKAAHTIRLQLYILNASSEHDFDPALVTLVQLKAGALVVGSDPLFNSQREKLVAIVGHHSIPAIYDRRDFVPIGGLMSYGANLGDAYRQVGIYTGRILKGEEPGDLPVVQPTKFDLVINLKTVKTLGLDVPPSLLAIADEVIE